MGEQKKKEGLSLSSLSLGPMTAQHARSALHAVCDGVGMAEPHPTTEETWEGVYMREQHKDVGVPEREDEMT